MPYRDSDHDELDETEFPDVDALAEEYGTMACPYCGEAILDDSVQCPHCSNFLSEEVVELQRKPWWIVVGVVVLLVVILLFWI